MKSSKTTAVAITAIGTGAFWCYVFLVMPALGAAARLEFLRVFALGFLLVFAAPGLLCLVYGFKLLYDANNTNITRSIGSALFIAAFMVSVEVEQIIEETFETKDLTNVATLLVMGVAIPVYVLIANNVRQSAHIPTNGLEELFSKPFVFLLSLQVWSAIMGIFMYFAPVKMTDASPYEFVLLMATILIPLLVAGFVYTKLGTAAGLIHKAAKHSEPRHA